MMLRLSSFFANWKIVVLIAAVASGGVGYVIVLRSQLDAARSEVGAAELRAGLAAADAAALQAAAEKMRAQAADLATSQERADAARRAAEKRLATATDTCLDRALPAELRD